MKSSLPNIFSCTVFKKHVSFLLDQNENNIKSSGLFYFLPSTLDRKEEILEWREHVHLHPIDLSIDDLIQTSNLTNINPTLLESNQRERVLTGYYKIMKKIAEISNQNLIRNSHAFLSAGGKTDPDTEFLWIDNSLKTTVIQFQLTYQFFLGRENVLLLSIEVMPNLLISYLSVKDVINLFHVSNIYRQTILKKFPQIYNISTGFCSADQWYSVI